MSVTFNYTRTQHAAAGRKMLSADALLLIAEKFKLICRTLRQSNRRFAHLLILNASLDSILRHQIFL